jgi:hypothetical protein
MVLVSFVFFILFLAEKKIPIRIDVITGDGSKMLSSATEAGTLNREKSTTATCTPGGTILGCELCRIKKESVISIPASEAELISSPAAALTHASTQQAFDRIYRERIWGDAGGGSGVGSTFENAEGATYILRMVIYKYGITKLMDAPCGALAWTERFVKELRTEIPCLSYTGVDIVPSVIEANRKKFSDYQFAQFYVRDISDPIHKLPHNQELILSRDSLQHLSMPLIKTAIQNYCAANAKYLLVGSYISAKKNKNRNISVGLAFSINLLLPPFSFPRPLEIFNERTRDGKYLLLYQMSELCNSNEVLNFFNSDLNTPETFSMRKNETEEEQLSIGKSNEKHRLRNKKIIDKKQIH